MNQTATIITTETLHTLDSVLSYLHEHFRMHLDEFYLDRAFISEAAFMHTAGRVLCELQDSDKIIIANDDAMPTGYDVLREIFNPLADYYTGLLAHVPCPETSSGSFHVDGVKIIVWRDDSKYQLYEVELSSSETTSIYFVRKDEGEVEAWGDNCPDKTDVAKWLPIIATEMYERL
ncbi:hypothetical protein H0A66_18570 [Alcaligenaceae bacterium]|nr:hypothetical protein [Alcaligenaceae bacterium]